MKLNEQLLYIAHCHNQPVRACSVMTNLYMLSLLMFHYRSHEHHHCHGSLTRCPSPYHMQRRPTSQILLSPRIINSPHVQCACTKKIIFLSMYFVHVHVSTDLSFVVESCSLLCSLQTSLRTDRDPWLA